MRALSPTRKVEVALPPPGMISASHLFSSSGLRTWITCKCLFPEVFCSIASCSVNAPWSATIPVEVKNALRQGYSLTHRECLSLNQRLAGYLASMSWCFGP